MSGEKIESTLTGTIATVSLPEGDGAPGDFIPARIVSLQPSITLILESVGELSRVVACTRYCAEVCAGVRDGRRLIVADSWTAQAAQIAPLHPDLVIASVPYQENAVAEILKSGARFLGFAPRTLDDIYKDIVILAGVAGAAERGRGVAMAMQKEIADVRQRTAMLPGRPRVFCEEWGKPLIRSQHWVKELVEAAGGDFVGEPGKTTSADEVRQVDPEVIVAAWCGAGDRVPLEKIVRDRGWEQTAAVRSGRVFCISDALLNTPAPNLVEGLHALAWAIHPELFSPTQGIRQISQ
jgi:iron complex transport system substrate-binding protein